MVPLAYNLSAVAVLECIVHEPESHALDAPQVGSPGNPSLVLGIFVAGVGNKVCCESIR